jgi:flavodoxin
MLVSPAQIEVAASHKKGTIMNALVIYDSKYGNTELIALAIGGAIGGKAGPPVASLKEIQELPADLDLLIVGGPTHAHGVPAELRIFLDDLPDNALQGVAVAAFDTRFQLPVLLTGSAAHGIAKLLRKKGGYLVRQPASFFIEHGEGPLVEGEINRATEWTYEIIKAMSLVA